jgi:hypothetical protein
VPYKTKFLPEHIEKYVGNSSKILCKSLWERKLCKYFDDNESVINWCYECLKIPYVSPVDGQKHTYFPDFVVKMKTKEGKETTLIVEVKPHKQTLYPTNKKAKCFKDDVARYMINESKWKAAKTLCEQNNWQFKLLTEKNIFK